MSRKLWEIGEQGPFPQNPAGDAAGEPAEEPAEESAQEPAEKPADWSDRLRGPEGERLGLLVPFEQPAHISAAALCLEGSGSSSSRGTPKRMPMLCNAGTFWAGTILKEEERQPACVRSSLHLLPFFNLLLNPDNCLGNVLCLKPHKHFGSQNKSVTDTFRHEFV